MRFIKNQYRILEVNVKIFSNFFINKVIVRHKDDVCSSCPVFHGVVWAKDLFLCGLVQFFNIKWIPGKRLVNGFSVLIVYTWVETLLHTLAPSVESESSCHVDGRVNAKMISRGYYDCPWLKHGIFQFLLDLRELRMSSRSIDNFWRFNSQITN